MLLSLLVYSLTGATLFFLGWHVNKREQQSLLQDGAKLPFYSWEILLSLLIFAVIAGARYHTGYDHAMYLDQYQILQETGDFSRHNFEYGFEWISRLFAYFKIHYFFYFAFWALLQIGFLYFGLRNHKHLLCWVGLGIMCGSYFLGWMNSIRQAVVVCLFVALVPLIKNRKFEFYVLAVILAALFHKSALLLLAVLVIPFFKLKDNLPNKWVLLSVFAVFVLLGSFPFWIDFFYDNQWFLDLTGYSNYSNMNDPNVAGKFRMVNWGPSRLLILFGNLSVIWFYPELKSHFKDDKLLPYFFMLAFVGMCLSNLLMNTTHFILRPVEYFIIFYLVMSAYLMCYLFNTKKYAICAVMFMAFYLLFVNNVYKAVYLPSVTNQPFLYHFFFYPSL
ncbi:MAG: EpsG family protein [Muribaculaceae bacterium]|nr:EpsG family protein [Muribaculaceae bacterium]